ncbi:MAG: hypothetical protein ACFWTO_22570 [Hafnia paralvei]|jgi:hypothetical protein
MYSNLEAGHIFEVEEKSILSDGTAGGVEPIAAMLKLAPEYQGKKVAIVLCGKNIVLDKYLKAIE